MRRRQKPLLDFLRLHRRRVVLPAAAVHHLLIRQHRLAQRAPIHAAAFAVRQSAFEHAQKKPLVPAVIFRLAGGNFAPPVVAESESLADRLHLRDVGVCPIARSGAALDRRVFRRQSERVPSDRMQHVESAHAFVARHGVADRVIPHVAHVQSTGGIRQHLEDVIFRLAGLRIRLERAFALPAFAPLFFDCLRNVIRHGFPSHRTRVPRRRAGMRVICASS